MKAKLRKLLELYQVLDLVDLYTSIEQHYPDAVSWHVLGKLAQNNLRRLPINTLSNLCQVFGLTQLSQLIDFDHSSIQPSTNYLEYPPESIQLISHLPRLMKENGLDLAKLRTATGMNYSTVDRWSNDFQGLQAIGFDTLDSLGTALGLETIDQLIEIKPIGRLWLGNCPAPPIRRLLSPDCYFVNESPKYREGAMDILPKIA